MSDDDLRLCAADIAARWRDSSRLLEARAAAVAARLLEVMGAADGRPDAAARELADRLRPHPAPPWPA